ncbi:endo-1,4-beta-xylanase [candidate division KSB1 bacterium]|nr:endo-1,4-beta-xylanase [candidate division KSB1 bacterium]
MKQAIILLSLFCAIFAANAQPPEPSGRRLREIVETLYSDGSIIIGATAGYSDFGTNTIVLLDREFCYVTSDNDFKQMTIHPDNSYWNTVEPYAWLQHIIENNQILRMHSPIGPQCSAWAKWDSTTATELDSNMTQFLRELCRHSNGQLGVEYMDVVNETIVNGEWHTDKSGFAWECPWYKIGVDSTDKNLTPIYITKAFELVQRYGPDIKFIYNHHEPPVVYASWNLLKETIYYLRNQGLRVDGIGWQAHIDNGTASPENLLALDSLITWTHNNHLEFHITEASVWLKNGYYSEILIEQAATYRAIVDLLLEKRFNGKVGWNTWNIDDATCWHKEWFPGLFDADYFPKPAYCAIQTALENDMTGIAHTQENELIRFAGYPNPFNSAIRLFYSVLRTSHIKIEIFNILGKIEATILDEFQASGNYTIDWCAPKNLISTIFFARITINAKSTSIKLIAVK